MRNRASSSPVDAVAPPWYRQRWPWLLVAGPSLVVVASLASAWIAVKSDDGVIAEDYYRQGLLINQKLAREMPAEQAHGATISACMRRLELRPLLIPEVVVALCDITRDEPGLRPFHKIFAGLHELLEFSEAGGEGEDY